jgi:hypothetical protein
MYHRFVVSLDELTFNQLADRAERERRGVREQATLLLERVLKSAPRRPRRDDQRLPSLAGSGPVPT